VVSRSDALGRAYASAWRAEIPRELFVLDLSAGLAARAAPLTVAPRRSQTR
jgi:hypothetical protein